MRVRLNLIATLELRDPPDQQVPRLGDVRFIEGPGERTPPDMEELVAEQTIHETETPQGGLGFLVQDCDGVLIGRCYDNETARWM